MPTRSFGTQLGPGTRILEDLPPTPIPQGPFGSSMIVGDFRAGPVGAPLRVTSLPEAQRVFGGLTRRSLAPLCVSDFFEAGGAAGVLYITRIAKLATDNDLRAGRVAGTWVFARDPGADFVRHAPDTFPTFLGRVIAAGPGDRDGGEQVLLFSVADLSAALTGTSGVTLPAAGIILSAVNELAGGTLYLSTFPGRSWRIAANTASVVQIDGDWPADVAASTAAAVIRIEKASVDPITGRAEGMAVRWTDSDEGRDGAFGMRVETIAGETLRIESELQLGAETDAYWVDAIGEWTGAQQTDFRYLFLVDGSTGVDVSDEAKRPANLAELIAPWETYGPTNGRTVIPFVTARWSWVTNESGSDLYIRTDSIEQPTSARACLLRIEFQSTTTFTVQAVQPGKIGESGLLYDIEGDALPNGTVGAEYTGGSPYFPTFTIVKPSGGTDPQAGDEIQILSRPLPAGLSDLDATVYANGVPLRVVSNTATSVQVLSSVDVASTWQVARGAIKAGSQTGTFDLSTTSDTFKFKDNGGSEITLTSTLTGAAQTPAEVAADLNARELASAGSAAAVRIEFLGIPAGSSDDAIAALVDGWGFDELPDAGSVVFRQVASYGAASTIEVTDGTLNAILGYTDDEVIAGVDGEAVRLEFRQPLTGGAAPYVNATDARSFWDTARSDYLASLEETNTGLLKLGMPGINDAEAQAAMMRYARGSNALAGCEVPANMDLPSAIAWHKANLAIGDAQDFHDIVFPSYLQRSNPYGAGMLDVPVIGEVLGMEAKAAAEQRGYHRAPAGIGFRFRRAKRLPAIFDASGSTSRPFLELANSYGFRPIRTRAGAFYLYGDRIPGNEAKVWYHKRATLSHIGRVLLVNLDRFHFAPNDENTWNDLRGALTGLFLPWVRAGWFERRGTGNDVSAFVDIEVSEATNPPDQRDAGIMGSRIGFAIVNTAEVVEVSLGAAGITVRE